MRKLLITLTLVFGISALVSAQDYNTAIGFRGGPYLGLTVKHFVSEKAAVEGLFSTRWQGFEVTGLYEIHNRAFDVDRLNWYYGVGAHLGFYNGDNTSWGELGEVYTVLGIDGIIGLEYNIAEIPVNISIDWKPAFNLVGYSRFFADGAALSIRYTF
ncbi:MAG TPA: hypothetical protein PLX41_10210 [Bacteroidales bacterium]|nr:hypothetical protein [Bacteroidales bacterium]HPR74021.1 hypothetical protein [Bacteroidales bacterium]